MATQVLSQPRIYRGQGGRMPPILGGPEEPWIKETASQTYKGGDLVYQDTNGTIAICTVSSNAHTSFILGQADVDATGTTGAQTRVRPIRPADIYMMNLYHSTPASAVGTDATIGTIHGIWQVSTTLQWCVDLVNTAEATTDVSGRVRVVGIAPRAFDGAANAITDIYAVVLVQFLPFTVGLNTNDPTGFKRLLQYQ